MDRMEEKLPQLKNVIYYSLLLIILCFVSIWLTNVILKYYKMHRKIRNIPGPPAFPIFGHLQMIFSKNYVQEFIKLSHNYPSIFKLWAGPYVGIVIDSADYVKLLLNNEKLLGKPFFYDTLEDVLGKGLLTLSGSVWQNHRKIISQSFSKKMLEPVINIFEEKSRTLVDVLHTRMETKYVDLYYYFIKYTLDAIYQSSLDVQTDNLRSHENFGKVTERLSYLAGKRFFQPWLYPNSLWKLSSTYKQYSPLRSLYHNTISEIIKKKFELEKDVNRGNKKQALLDPFIENPKITQADIRNEISTFTLAGAETTARTLNFVAIVLGMYPHIQQKVYEEITDIFGSKGPVTVEGLTMMNYTERVIKETQRIFPTIPFIAREASEDIQLDGKIIPAGSVVIINIITLHRNPKYWTDPLKFDPDRFLPEENAKRNSCAYIPFSQGLRKCIGWKYAMLNMKTVLIEFLRNFEIHTEYKSIDEISLQPYISLHIEDGSKLWLEKRKIN